MDYKDNTLDREFDKFVEGNDGTTLVRTTSKNPAGVTLVQLQNLRMLGCDLRLQPLIINNRSMPLTLNSGALMYSE